MASKYSKLAKQKQAEQEAIISSTTESVEPDISAPVTVESVDAPKRKRGRPSNEQERVPFTTRVRADVRKKINIGAATYDVKPSDIIDALVDQYFDALDWGKVGADRH